MIKRPMSTLVLGCPCSAGAAEPSQLQMCWSIQLQYSILEVLAALLLKWPHMPAFHGWAQEANQAVAYADPVLKCYPC